MTVCPSLLEQISHNRKHSRAEWGEVLAVPSSGTQQEVTSSWARCSGVRLTLRLHPQKTHAEQQLPPWRWGGVVQVRHQDEGEVTVHDAPAYCGVGASRPASVVQVLSATAVPSVTVLVPAILMEPGAQLHLHFTDTLILPRTPHSLSCCSIFAVGHTEAHEGCVNCTVPPRGSLIVGPATWKARFLPHTAAGISTLGFLSGVSLGLAEVPAMHPLCWSLQQPAGVHSVIYVSRGHGGPVSSPPHRHGAPGPLHLLFLHKA